MFGSKGRKKGGGSVFVSQEREEREENESPPKDQFLNLVAWVGVHYKSKLFMKSGN
jgi:hypothetical protein